MYERSTGGAGTACAGTPTRTTSSPAAAGTPTFVITSLFVLLLLLTYS